MISRFCYLLVLTVGMTLSVQAADLTRGFLADTEQAMTKMDSGMMAKPSGDVDHDFVQIAIAMALLALATLVIAGLFLRTLLGLAKGELRTLST